MGSLQCVQSVFVLSVEVLGLSQRDENLLLVPQDGHVLQALEGRDRLGIIFLRELGIGLDPLIEPIQS